MSQAVWYVVLDGSGINSDEVGKLLCRVNDFELKASGFFRNFRIIRSPRQDLIDFQQAARYLSRSLFAYAIPILGLLLAFIGMVAAQAIENRRNEIAVTRIRGASNWQVLGIISLEFFLLGLAALFISLPLARFVAQSIGLTRSFMEFTSRQPLVVILFQCLFSDCFVCAWNRDQP